MDQKQSPRMDQKQAVQTTIKNPSTASNESLNQFYESLANTMEEGQLRFVWSPTKQEKSGLMKTLFIPFDETDKEDNDGYGLYLYLHQINAPNEVSHCIIAAATMQIANPKVKKEIALLLHEINLNLPVPGWILDDKENLLIFKYLFPVQISSKIPKAYLTLIVEVFNGITNSFPLLKEVIEGKEFSIIRDEVASRLTPTKPNS